MSLTRITARLGGTARHFELRIGEIAELERLCNAGIGEVIGRVDSGRWRFADIRETIRLGLEGGGTAPVEADILTERYVDERPLGENVPLASAILGALLGGSAAINAAMAEVGGAGRGEEPGEPGAGPATAPDPAI